MKRIAQRTLRNESSEILRRAEAGERFVITVHGRPVAALGPYSRRQWVPAQSVRDLLHTPTDSQVLEELRTWEPEPVGDPWQR
jgi:prevent-host-death family protein